MITIVMDTNIGEIRATYDGRVYIHVGYHGQPAQEVINVFNYQSDTPEIANTPDAVEEKLRWWLHKRFPELIIDETSRTWRSEDE